MDDLYSLNIKSIKSTMKDEGLSFALICLYLFFEYVRPQSIYAFVDILPWVPLLLIITFIALLLQNELKIPSCLLNKLIVLYGIIVIASSVFGKYPDVSLTKLRVFFDWFIIYFLIIIIVKNERRFYIFLSLFLLFSFKMSQHGFISWAQKGFGFDGWGVTGAPGWFHNSGEVGIQMCIYVPLSIAFIAAAYNHLSKKWLFVLLLMPFTGIATAIASSSRGALIGLSVAGIRPLLIRPRLFIQFAVLLSFLTLIVIHLIPDESKQRFEDSGKDITSLHRLERWRHGIDTMNHYPLLGIGFEAWTEYYPRHYNPKYHGTPLVHNIFIQCGSELGYIGLCVFFLMLVACLIKTHEVRKLCKGKKDQFLCTVSYGFDAALIGFLCSGFFVTVLYYPFFWVHCALVACLHNVTLIKYKE